MQSDCPPEAAHKVSCGGGGAASDVEVTSVDVGDDVDVADDAGVSVSDGST